MANGASTTEVDGSLQQLTSAPHAIHMHKSSDELPIYVACADIKLAAAEAGQPGTLPRSGHATSLATLAAALSGLALATLGFAIRRRAAPQGAIRDSPSLRDVVGRMPEASLDRYAAEEA